MKKRLGEVKTHKRKISQMQQMDLVWILVQTSQR